MEIDKIISDLIEVVKSLLAEAHSRKGCKEENYVFQRRELYFAAARTFRTAEGMCEIFIRDFDNCGLIVESELNKIFSCEVSQVSTRILIRQAVKMNI